MGESRFREENPNWRGGRSIASNGYVIVRIGVEHHLADVRGYAYEHRLVAEQKLGRRLRAGEQVHHVNGNKADNQPENIEVAPSLAHHRAEHRRHDRGLRDPGAPNPIVSCECGCDARFRKFDTSNRPRRFLPGHNTAVRNG